MKLQQESQNENNEISKRPCNPIPPRSRAQCCADSPRRGEYGSSYAHASGGGNKTCLTKQNYKMLYQWNRGRRNYCGILALLKIVLACCLLIVGQGKGNTIYNEYDKLYSDLGFYPRFALDYNNGPNLQAGIILLGSKFESNGMAFWGTYIDGKFLSQSDIMYGPTLGLEAGCAGNFSIFGAIDYTYLIANEGTMHNLNPRFGFSLGYINLYSGYNFYWRESGRRRVVFPFQFGAEININHSGLKHAFPKWP